MDLDATAFRGITDLGLAVQRERRLIDALRQAAVRQRQAVVLGDLPAVESSVRLAARALLTLQEARRHRADMLQRLVGDPAQPLHEIAARFESPLPAPFREAVGQMRQAAIETADEVWRNQELFLSALRERDALLQELLTGTRPTPPETASGSTAAG